MQREISYYSPHNGKMLKVTLIPAKGFFRALLTILDFGAITLPGRRIVMLDFLLRDENLITHELMHVEQYERLGTARFLWKYFTLWLRHGYKNHPMEREARLYAKRR